MDNPSSAREQHGASSTLSKRHDGHGTSKLNPRLSHLEEAVGQIQVPTRKPVFDFIKSLSESAQADQAQGRLAGAIFTWERVCQLYEPYEDHDIQPDRVGALYSLALCYKKVGRPFTEWHRALRHGIYRATAAKHFKLCQLLCEECPLDLLPLDGPVSGLQEVGPSILLIIAVVMGANSILELLLRYGADINCRNFAMHKSPLLHTAVRYKKPKTVELLLALGVDPNETNDMGNTALHYGAEIQDSVDSVKLLLKAGADIDATNKVQCTPLHNAAMIGSDDVLVYLLQSKAKVKVEDSNGCTALHSSIHRNCYETEKQVPFGQSWVTQNWNEQKAPHSVLPIPKPSLKAVEALIDAGSDIDAYSQVTRLPIIAAAARGLEQIVQTLLDRGASTDSVSGRGVSPLMAAAACNRENVVRLLLGNGVPVNDIGGWSTASLAALFNGHVDLARWLLSQGAIIGENGTTSHQLLEMSLEDLADTREMNIEHSPRIVELGSTLAIAKMLSPELLADHAKICTRLYFERYKDVTRSYDLATMEAAEVRIPIDNPFADSIQHSRTGITSTGLPMIPSGVVPDREAIGLVASVTASLLKSPNAKFDMSLSGMETAFKIAQRLHFDRIDDAVAPPGATELSDNSESERVDHVVEISHELRDAEGKGGVGVGARTRIGGIQPFDEDARSQTLVKDPRILWAAQLARIRVSAAAPADGWAARLSNVCRYCDELVGFVMENLSSWDAFRGKMPELRHHAHPELLKKYASTCRLCYLLSFWHFAYGMGSGGEYFLAPHHREGMFSLMFRSSPTEIKAKFCVAQEHACTMPVGSSEYANPLLWGRQVFNQPDTWEGYALQISWLKTCMGHERCKRPSVTPLPTRVIDVGIFGTGCLPALYVSNGESAPYTTLSYCWGGALSVQLTRATLQSFQNGINMDEIPLTFQHAILLTRTLGVRYIWIDALCIVQDDFEDWTREAARMYDIYARSLLTISATTHSDPNEGLFNRAFNSYKQAILHTNPDSRYAALGKLYIEKIRTMDPSMIAFGATTMKRGWILQERIASPAVLHFTKGRMVWECRTHLLSEDGHMKKSHPFLKHVLSLGNGLLANGDFMAPDRIWYSIVFEFTIRKLTFSSDKMAAIAGLAREFGRRYFDGYLAGIWASDLPKGLLWFPQRFGAYIPPGKSPQPELPSWSWARLDSSIDHATFSDDEHIPTDYDLEIISTWIDHDDEFTLYTAPQCGRIEVQGFVQKTVLTGRSLEKKTGCNCLEVIGLDGGADPTETPCPCYCLIVQTYSRRSQTNIRTLLLLIEETGVEGEFQRIGVATLSCWFRGPEDPEDIREWEWDFSHGFPDLEPMALTLV